MQQHVAELVKILERLAEISEDEELMIPGQVLNASIDEDEAFDSFSEEAQELILSFQDTVDDLYLANPEVTPVDLAASLRDIGYAVHDLDDNEEVTWTHYINLPYGHLRF